MFLTGYFPVGASTFALLLFSLSTASLLVSLTPELSFQNILLFEVVVKKIYIANYFAPIPSGRLLPAIPSVYCVFSRPPDSPNTALSALFLHINSLFVAPQLIVFSCLPSTVSLLNVSTLRQK